MNLVELLMNKKAIGEFIIVESHRDCWIGAVVEVGEFRGHRHIKVRSVNDKGLNHYINKPLPVIGAVTSSEFARIRGGN